MHDNSNKLFRSLATLIWLLTGSAWGQQYPGYPPYPYGQAQQQTYPYGQTQQQPHPYGQAQQQPYSEQQPYPQPHQTPNSWPGYQNRGRQAPLRPPGYQYPAQQFDQRTSRQQTWPQAPTARYAQPSTQSSTSNAPRLELEIVEHRPYTQQPVLMALRIISDSNLKSAQPELTGAGPFVFSKLDGPIASARQTAGGQEIVNEYRYAFTPLQPGKLDFPRIRVKGTLASGQDFDVLSGQPVQLDIQAAAPEVQPWLPLHGLIVQSFLQDSERPEAGKPITLTVFTSAIGATGSQLPSFEQQLQTRDFHVYRESSDVEGKISSDGRFLLGQRTETFTLVPLHGGKIQIPELSVSWWNVDTGNPEVVRVPIRQLVAKGEPGADDDPVTDLFPGASSLILWVPLVGLFSLTIGFWLLAWLRNKHFIQVVEEEIAAVLSFGSRQFRGFVAWLAPVRRLQKVRQLFVKALPSSFRLWFCARVVDNETDPEVWSYMLKFLANKHLGIPPQLPLRDLAERLAAKHPRADEQAIRALMQELETSLYGDGQVDFRDWKKRFRAQLRPRWTPFPRTPRRPARSKTARLPQLNPGTG